MIDEKQIEKDIIKEKIRCYYKQCNVPYLYQMLIEEALESTEWDFMDPNQYDGCSGVSEFHYDQYPFDCLVHDFHWRTGRGGIVADSIFKDNMEFRGLAPIVIKKRYLGVRFFWGIFYKWKHKLNKNVKPLTPAMKLYKDIKGIK